MFSATHLTRILSRVPLNMLMVDFLKLVE